MAVERITTRKILSDLGDILNLKSGVPYTLWRIQIAPGKTIKTFLFEDRSRLVPSFRLLSLSLPFPHL